MSRCRSCDGRSLCKCRECRWLQSYARLHVYAWIGVLACALTCVVWVCACASVRVHRCSARACMQCRFASWCVCHAVSLRLGLGNARSCSRDTYACEFTPRKWSGQYVHNRQQIHDVTDSAESFIGPSIARISYGYRTDVRGMYGGCTADVRLYIVQIPYGYRSDITEPLPLRNNH